MAYDAFLKIDGIPGESLDDKHKDWIEILSYSHEMTQPSSATVSSAGGGTTERVDHGDLRITKHIDKASPKIYESLSKGAHIPNVIIEFCRAGGDKLKYLEIKMEQVIIAGARPGGTSKHEDGFPVEEIDFNYGKIKWTYTQQKRADGTGGGNVAGGWDLVANKVHS
jgi:type VI secretion system secreted protein Hcp